MIPHILLPSHEKIPIVEYYTISYHEKVSYKRPILVGAFPGVDCHIWAIQVCAAVKGMVFKQFTLG